jgi:CRISPR-associated endonuclease/helicase Cas3
VQLPDEFEAFFLSATGKSPYEYQRALGGSPTPPDILEVPTGAGKTHAVLVAWLYERLVKRRGPRRLVYALPMRSLVEQTATVAREIRVRLELSAEDIPIHVLMGGESEDDWREQPEHSQILVGTIDMLLSRALNRGYGENRFRWPVSFGLLNADCRWVFDEVQLMGPARATSAQLDGLRAKLGTALPCQTVWVSATVDAGALETVDRPQAQDRMSLPEKDRKGRLASRLTASKTVERLDLGGVGRPRRPRAVAEGLVSRHVAGTRTIVVLNTVERAQLLTAALGKELRGVAAQPKIVLLHSRYRPGDRAAQSRDALTEVDPQGSGVIVVATQVIEAGLDVSSRLLATETAPFSSIVQRAGRCNREGEHPEASLLWLDTGDPAEKDAAPYEAEDLVRARLALSDLVGLSASPERLSEIEVVETSDDHAVLRRRDLIDLFDTAPDLSGMDVDVSAFIRDDDDRTVSVFFRAVGEMSFEARAKQPRPRREELVGVPIGDVRDRTAWVHDHVEGTWVRATRDLLRPGMEVMLDAASGGYDEHQGWNPAARSPVPVFEPDDAPPPESTADDPMSVARVWMDLEEHLGRAYGAAAKLAEALELADDEGTAISEAAALHDIGKAHPAFQAMLVSTADASEQEWRKRILWAKSAHRGGRHQRKFFRHELASALALRAIECSIASNQPDRELITYLVGSHHGRVRLGIRPAPSEAPPVDARSAPRFALGVAEGDELPGVQTPLGHMPATTLDLECMELGGGGRSWTEAACLLRDGHGPFRLAFLEALVQVADWRASG